MYTCRQSTWWECFNYLLNKTNPVSDEVSLHRYEPGAPTPIPICNLNSVKEKELNSNSNSEPPSVASDSILTSSADHRSLWRICHPSSPLSGGCQSLAYHRDWRGAENHIDGGLKAAESKVAVNKSSGGFRDLTSAAAAEYDETLLGVFLFSGFCFDF